MAEYILVQDIPSDVTRESDNVQRRRHFVRVLRSIQYGCFTLCADVDVFRNVFDIKSGTPPVLADRKSKLFLETLFYHVAVFKKALKDIEEFVEAGEISPGSAMVSTQEPMGFDLEPTSVGTDRYLEVLSNAVAALRITMGSPEYPFKDSKFAGLPTPTAALESYCFPWFGHKNSGSTKVCVEYGEGSDRRRAQ